MSERVTAEPIQVDSLVTAGTPPPATPGEAAAPALHARRDWAGRLRRWHYISATPLALIILFYAVTGFLANRSDLFVGEATASTIRTMPVGALLDREHLVPVLAAMLPDGVQLTSFNEGPPITAIFQHDAGAAWAVTVDPTSGKISLIKRGTLPDGLELTPAAVGAHLATRLSGSPDLDNATSADGAIELEMASVWGTHRVQVDTASRTWTATTVRPPLIVSLTDLHRGKHAGWWQRVIIDVTALVLALVTLSGAAMSVFAVSSQRRRQALILLASSAVLLVCLLFSR